MHDRAGAHVSSALGVSTPAVEVHPDLNFLSLAKNHQAAHGALDYLVGDEAQFYTDPQVEQLAQVVDELDATRKNNIERWTLLKLCVLYAMNHWVRRG